MRTVARRDKNERAIIEALEKAGVAVTQLSQKGVPDLLCSLRGVWFTVECKSAQGKLTEDQQEFIAKHHADVHIARSKKDVDFIVRNV